MHLCRDDLVSNTKYSAVLQVLLPTALKFSMPLGISFSHLMMWLHADLLIWEKMKQNILCFTTCKNVKTLKCYDILGEIKEIISEENQKK